MTPVRDDTCRRRYGATFDAMVVTGASHRIGAGAASLQPRRDEFSIVVPAPGLEYAGRVQAAACSANPRAPFSFAKSLAAQVAEHGVPVNTVFPGVVETPQIRAAIDSEGKREHWMVSRGLGTPGDVAGPGLSDAPSMISSTPTRDRAYAQEDR